MGLDGISINQLRITNELNSADLNSASVRAVDEIKVVDGLSSGQRVNPDKENGHDFSYDGEQKKREEESSDEETVTKYDLSDTSKYVLKLDDETNQIHIIEKATGNVIQIVDAEELSKFLIFSSNSCGSMINKKF